MKNNIFIIIPAYNEAKRIADVIKKAKKYSKDIVVVDDGSSDGTYDVSKKEGVTVLRHAVNLGKGAALKTGIDLAYKSKAKAVVMIDSDGQHDPDMIPEFIKDLEKHDVVFGYRRLNKKMPSVLRFGNWFINTVTKLLYNIELKDTQCGYRAFNLSKYKLIRWRALDYSVESEMIANIGKHKLSYKEVEIATIYSDDYKGTTVLDGIKIVFNMILWKLRG